MQISISNAIGSRYRSASTPPVDPDAQAFITAAAITDPTQQAAINTLVVDLKGYNIWTKMKALYPFVGSTASQHKWNLKDPRDLDAAFRLVFNGGWTHSSTGALPNGTNAYASTKLSPSSALTNNNTHLSFYSRTSTITNAVRDLAVFQNSGLPAMSLGTNTGVWVSDQNDFNIRISSSIASATGFYTGTRTSSTSHKLYKNGSVLGTNTSTNSTGLPDVNLFIGAANIAIPSQEIASNYSNKQCAFASIGDGLTDTEAANFYTAVQAFQTTIGRSIGTQTVSDADAQAFVTNAGIVDQVEANAINNLVIGMKADGLWTKMKAIYPMVGGTNSQHTWNLKNTAQYQISWQGGVTSSNNGVQFGGVNGYGITGIIPSSVSTLNSTHMSFYSRTTFGNSGVDDFGAFVNVNQIQRLMIKNGALNDHIVDMNSTSQRIAGTVTVPSGLFLANRETSTALRSLRNNVSLGTNTNTNTGTLPNIGMFIGALNNVGSAVNYSVRECAFASYGDGLTATDETNLYSRVQAFNTTLNRQV